MIEYETKLRKWENSIGLIISKKMVKVKDIFGKLKFKKSTEEIMKEADKEL